MDQTQLRSAAAEYPYLRGLISVPAGLLFIVAALGNAEWGPFRHDWVFIAALLVIAAACAAINRFYNEHYGRVTPSTRQQVKAAAVAGAGVVLMIVLSLLLRSRASWSLDLPVNPIPAVFGGLMLAYSAAVAGLRPHHLVIWGSLIVAGAAARVGRRRPQQRRARDVRRRRDGQRRLRPPPDRAHARPRDPEPRQWLTRSSSSTSWSTSPGGSRS